MTARFPPTDDRASVRIKLLGNPDLMRRLREVFEAYDTDADPDKSSEAVVEVIVKHAGLVVPSQVRL